MKGATREISAVQYLDIAWVKGQVPERANDLLRGGPLKATRDKNEPALENKCWSPRECGGLSGPIGGFIYQTTTTLIGWPAILLYSIYNSVFVRVQMATMHEEEMFGYNRS